MSDLTMQAEYWLKKVTYKPGWEFSIHEDIKRPAFSFREPPSLRLTWSETVKYNGNTYQQRMAIERMISPQILVECDRKEFLHIVRCLVVDAEVQRADEWLRFEGKAIHEKNT